MAMVKRRCPLLRSYRHLLTMLAILGHLVWLWWWLTPHLLLLGSIAVRSLRSHRGIGALLHDVLLHPGMHAPDWRLPHTLLVGLWSIAGLPSHH